MASKWLDVKACNVTNRAILIDAPTWDWPRSFVCGNNPVAVQANLEASGATVWMEMPKRAFKASGRNAVLGGYTEEFEREVWGPYPRKEGTSKAVGFRKWQALSVEMQAQCKAAIPVYAQMVRGKEQQFIKHLEFFISGRIFETIKLPRSPASVPSAPDAPQIADGMWPGILRVYQRTNSWNPELGPPPGTPGCRAPQKYLETFGLPVS